jgi:nucleotide-binding universal stress UspA family protein
MTKTKESNTMFQRILVPLDGSPRAERAIPAAAHIARASGGTVILVRVIGTAANLWSSDTTQTDLTEIERYLTEIKATSNLEGIATEIVALSGPAAFTILHAAHASQADLIVLCRHGYRGTTRMVLGSVAEKVAYHAVVPVLILNEEGPVPPSSHPEATRPLRVLVSQDGSALAVAALEPAASLIAALAAPATAALHLAWVVDPKANEQTLEEAKQNLSAIVKQLHASLVVTGLDHTLTITWSVASGTDVASTLVSLAEHNEGAGEASVPGDYDVIAMATHGQSRAKRWPIGGTTQRVLNATRLPLLVVRALDIVDKSHLIWDEATITLLLEWS